MKAFQIAGVLLAASFTFACNNVDFKKTKGGVAYKIFTEKKSKDSIKVGDVVKYNVIRLVSGKNKKDSIIQNTYELMPQFEDVRDPMPPNYLDPFSEILTKAHVGDSIYYEQLVDSFIAKQPDLEVQTPFRKGDKLISKIRIVKVFKSRDSAQADFMLERAANAGKLEAQQLKGFLASPEVQQQMAVDNKIIEDYTTKNNIKTEKSPWGAYVQVIDPGVGPKPSAGQFLNVKFNGTSLEGASFDSGTYPLQFGGGGSIKGFEEGLRYLGKGGKAKVFVPSMLAYGPKGREPKIKPNEVLIFDLELLDISDTPPMQQPVMPRADSSAATKR